MLQAPRIVRWTLPALLLTLVIGACAIVVASGREGDEAPRAAPTTTTAVERGRPRRATVRRGDTASAIARRAKLTELELLELNPDLDPGALRAGQRLRIRR